MRDTPLRSHTGTSCQQVGGMCLCGRSRSSGPQAPRQPLRVASSASLVSVFDPAHLGEHVPQSLRPDRVLPTARLQTVLVTPADLGVRRSPRAFRRQGRARNRPIAIGEAAHGDDQVQHGKHVHDLATQPPSRFPSHAPPSTRHPPRLRASHAPPPAPRTGARPRASGLEPRASWPPHAGRAAWRSPVWEVGGGASWIHDGDLRR